jgi:hypothetical protein
MAAPRRRPGQTSALAAAQRQELEALEQTIERGLATFIEVGQALAEIRESRLYRAGFDTFEDYCRERWGMERAHAYRQIEAAQVAAVLSPNGDIPANEAQARELARLKDEPEKLAEAWEEASSNGAPTAGKVHEAVQKVARPTPEGDKLARLDAAVTEAERARDVARKRLDAAQESLRRARAARDKYRDSRPEYQALKRRIDAARKAAA